MSLGHYFCLGLMGQFSLLAVGIMKLLFHIIVLRMPYDLYVTLIYYIYHWPIILHTKIKLQKKIIKLKVLYI